MLPYDNDSLARLAHATGMTDVEFDERSQVEANLAEEAQRDEWCEGAGVPPDPFAVAFEEVAKVRHQAMVAQAEADQLFWQEQDQTDDGLPPEQVDHDWGFHSQQDM